MGSLVGRVLPLALGAAVSPILLTLQVLILAAGRAVLARVWAVVLGCALVLAAIGVLGFTVLSRTQTRSGSDTFDAVVKLVAAALLLGLAVRQLVKRPSAGEQHQSRLQQRVATASTPFFVLVGAVAMATNFTSIVLLIPALHEIERSDAGTSAQVAAAAVLFGCTLLPVLVPAVLVTAAGSRAPAMLAPLNRLMTTHRRAINAAICLLFAAFLGVSGIQAL